VTTELWRHFTLCRPIGLFNADVHGFGWLRWTPIFNEKSTKKEQTPKSIFCVRLRLSAIFDNKNKFLRKTQYKPILGSDENLSAQEEAHFSQRWRKIHPGFFWRSSNMYRRRSLSALLVCCTRRSTWTRRDDKTYFLAHSHQSWGRRGRYGAIRRVTALPL